MESRDNDQCISDYMAKLIRCKACGLVGQAGFAAGDLEDIEQELTVDLLERLPKFDPGKASRHTFAARVVDRKISSMLRYRMQEMRDNRNRPRSLNELVPCGDGHTVELASTIEHDARRLQPRRRPEEDAGLRIDVEAVIAKLPPDLRRLAELLKHSTFKDAAKEMGMPRTTMYRLKQELREAFKKADLPDYL